MAIDIYTTRRNFFEKVYYWFYDSKNKDLNNLIYEKKPNGFFYAREENANTLTKEVIGQYFQVGSSEVAISTYDNASKLRPNDLVKFKNKLWVIVNIQKKVLSRQEAFNKNASARYFILIRGKDSGRI